MPRSPLQERSGEDRSRRVPGKSAWRWVAVAVLLGLILAVILLSVLGDGDEGTHDDAHQPPAEGDESAGEAHAGAHMEHIHGLGVDPSDGALLIASHYGLFRLDDGAPERLSEVQDFMGFTVVDEGRLLASGHPGQGQDAPSNLGLIESSDGGATWQEVSLGGEADFHALDAAGQRVYGVDATGGDQLMVSDDGGETWQSPEAPAMAGVAVDLRDPDSVLGTTPDGPVLSRDGGQSFAALQDAPLLLAVDWAADGTLYGLDPAGGLHRSDDDGATWEETQGSATLPEGYPEAVHAVDEDELWVAVEGAVLHSSDAGETFEAVHEE
ncbi:F510_1955 family glycosylhydrolase [Nesterenkonia sp. HG001]|uniref:F510_1955 family glycosylhydrolase n=1 Tax=Nesterenkonia sp. HG001 TaxID=2983207 RepID=UPI002AC5D6CD|nr:exo-alpha-sialidase [Nesterenkonia sp. HG001]MDZ5078222.1 exo-alpha-sialidase [Nesterenkonia sp. HG001]